MQFEKFYNRFCLDDEIVKKTGFNPYYFKLQSGLTEELVIEGKHYIDLASNNYLGLANDQRVKEAISKATEKFGASLCATPIASGCSDLYKQVSEHISSFLGLESSIIYPSCYQANNGLFSVITGKEDVIIIDQYAHSSLIEGAKTVGCKIRPFLHNNLENLEKNLRNSQKHRQVFVVTESVFSTEGSIAPFRKIVELCEKYNAVPVIDDSHGIGVIGKNGRGILEYEDISDFDGMYTASLGKAMANMGGVIAGRKDIIDYLRYYSSHLVYSTSIPPMILAGIEEVLNIVENEFEQLSSSLWRNRNTLYDALAENDYQLTSSKAPITSIISGSAEDTFRFAKKLFENRVFSTPFIYPSVPKNKGVIRLIAGANFKDSTIQQAIDVFTKLNKTS